MKNIYSTLCLMLLAQMLIGQITVTQNSNSQALSQLLAGNGVTISNYNLSCAANGSGTFTNVNTNLGMPGGVVLASGRVSNIPNNANIFASTQFTAVGDTQLSTLTTGTIYDPCVLQFDIVPQGPLLKFDYVFASEEYPEWVCSKFNDVFGFFITGPNPGGGNYVNQNIALIPNTPLPVAINTVNPGTPGANAQGGLCTNANQTLGYSSIYTNNQTPLNANIVYDGMTHLLTVSAAVTPCQRYHLKIAVADVADRIYDSGVFLSAYSFNSNPVSISASSNLNYAGFSSAYEGCVGGTFTLTISQPQPVDLYVPLSINGSAINGVDYTAIPTTVVIPAGQTSVTIPLNPLADGIVENVESVSISTLNPCTGAVSATANINIRDDIASSVTVGDSTLCLGQSTQLNANGGATYSWTPTAGLSNPAIKNPVATPTATTTYVCTMSFGACTKTVAQTIYVSNPANAITANPNGVVCNGGSVQLTSSPTNGVAPYSYLWNNGNTSATITALAGGTFNVTATDAYGCSASATQAVTISNLAITGTAANVSCVGGSNGGIDITVTGANAPFTYNWGGGIVSQDRNNLLAGTYTVTASNTIGCSVTASYTITQPASNLVSTATNTPVTCNGGNNGSINLTPNGGVTPYTFLWSNAAATEDINGLTAGAYSVTITDLNGCTTSRTINISQPTAISTSETHTNGNCFGSTVGAIDLTVTGGTGAYSYAWSNGAATQDVSALNAGNYGVTVADANGCTVARSITITQPAAVSITPAVTNPTCFGNSNGEINVTTAGGTTPYTYTWNNAATTQNLSGLPVGTYSVTATDGNGCTGSATATLSQPALLSATAIKTDVSCNGTTTGSVTTTVTGGTTPYTYNWGGGINTANRPNAGAGSYTVTVSDNNGCSVTANAVVLQPAALSLAQTHTNVACNGGATGSIDLTATGGTLPYSFSWGGGINTEDRNNLTAGAYSVTVTDAQSCSASLNTTISQPGSLSVSLTATNPVCNGVAGGAINTTSAGGTAPFAFYWNDAATTQNRTGIAAGNYSLTVTDNNGCSATASSSLTQPAAINITPTVTNATCAAGNNGTITLTVTGGAGGYTYNWGGGITTPARTGLVAGTYTVTVTDALGCTASLPVSVTQIGTGITLNTAVANVLCNGGSNGAIDLSVAGGIAPVTFNWGGSITTEDRSGLTAGQYSVTVTDGLGCSAVATSSITQPSALGLQRTSTNVGCYGANTGAINITATGGTGAYTYNWGGGITTQNRTNLTAGTYTVTVSDANLCTAVSSTTISQPVAAITASAVTTSVACFGGNNGQVDLSVTGGTAPYNYAWSNNNISQDLANVNSGTYLLTITDANNCSATFSTTVTQPAAALVSSLSATNILCNGANTGAITNIVTGGTAPFAFIWNDGNTLQNRTALSAGSYTVTVTDSKGCQATASATLSAPAALTVNSTPTNITCNGLTNGSITTSVSGGVSAYTFNWGGGINTQNRSNLGTGTYIVTVTDANNCTASASAVITQPTTLAVSMNSGTSVCANATGTATAVTNSTGTAPYNYVWSNGGANTQTQNGLAPGLITVTVTDANACSATASVTVGLSGNNTNANFTYTGSPCGPNATINFNHTGSTNVTHYWNFGNTAGTATLSNPSYTYPLAGTYQVTHVVTRGFCQDSLKQTITIHAKPVPAVAVTNVSCNGSGNGAISLTVSSGTPAFTYNWGGGITTQNRTSLAPGTYTVTVTDAIPCSTSITAVVTEPAAILVTNTNTNVTCNGGANGAINLAVAGGTPGYGFNWGGGITTASRTGLAGGTYTVTVTDANNCSSINNIVLYQPNAIDIAPAVTNASCNGMQNGAINLGVSGGSGTYSYDWGAGITTQNRTGLAAGNYTVTVADANSCTASTTVNVNQPLTLATALSGINAACFRGSNGSIATTTTGGTAPFNYIWNDNNTSENRQGLAAGSYTVTVTDANTCSATAAVTIAQPATAVSVGINNTMNVKCFGDSTGAVNITANGGTPGYTYTWNDGITQQNRINLQSGTYRVTVSDAQGCQATANTLITEPAQALTIDTTFSTDVLCFGAATGAINTTVSGGTLPYIYNWNDGLTTANRTGVTAGTYTLTVTDANLCAAVTSATISQPAAALSISATTTNINCNGANNGAIAIAASGGTTPYSFNWGNGITTQNRSNLSAGNYTLTLTDANGCTTTSSAAINQAAALNVAVASTTNVSCFGGNNGAITIVATGGTGVLVYSWADGVTTQNRTGLTAGNYSLTVTDGNSCSTTAAATIAQPATSLTASVASATNVSCFGANNGAIALSVTGGTTAYTYNWGGGIITQNRTNLAAGTYTVTVTDANACNATTTATITQPVAALSVSANAGNITCNGANNGAINVAVTGGTAPYSFNWGGGVTTQNRTNLSAGTYTVTVADSNSCTAIANATLTQPSALSVVVSSKTNVSCFGGNNGAVNITITGGTAPYSYNWSGGVTTQNRTNLAAGAYTVTVTDANSCSATAAATITQPNASLTATVASVTNISCFGANNGAIALSVTGGTTAYSYNWGGGVITQNRTNLAAGAYTVTVTDANACTATTTATITQPAAALSVAASATNITCNGTNNGAINVAVTGGTTPYSFNWGGGITTQNRTNLVAGAYTVTVTDANLCSALSSITITQPVAALSATVTTTAVSCFGGNSGSIDVSVSGGTTPYNYNWSNNNINQDLVNVNSGNYQLTITDGNNCTTSVSAVVTQPAASLTVTLSASNVLCNNTNTGSITGTINGGTMPYTFSWNDGYTQQNRANVAAGSYTLTVTDAKGCQANAIAVVNEPAALTVSTALTHINCNGVNSGAINVTATGGINTYSYNWGAGITSQNRTNLGAGIYTLTVTDGNNCSVSASAAIIQPPVLGGGISSITNVKCFGGNNGAVTINATGGTGAYSYNWGNGITSPARTGLAAGNYNVTVTDGKGCTAVVAANITQPSAPVAATITSANNISCLGGNNGTINVQATGGTGSYSYSWTNGATAQNLNNLVAGSYTVTVIDANGCSASVSAALSQPATSMQLLMSKTNLLCDGSNTGSINLTVNGGAQPLHFAWNNGNTSEDVQGLSAGTYAVIVTDNNGCTASSSMDIASPYPIVLTETHTNVTCNNQSNANIYAFAAGGVPPYHFLWNTNATTRALMNVSGGNYSVVVTDSNGCQAKLNSIVVEEPEIIGVGVNITNIACAGSTTGAVNVSVSGGTQPYQYQWSNNSNTEDLNKAEAGFYLLTVTDVNGCSQTASALVSAVPPMVLSGQADIVACQNSEGDINLSVSNGTAPYTFIWNNGATTEDITGVNAGTYHVTVSDANNCKADTSFTIVNLNNFSVTASGGGTIKLGETISLHATSSGSAQTTFSWTPAFGIENPANADVTVQPGRTTLYTVTGVDTNGCQAKDTVSVEVIEDHTIFPPNAFSPNGDGNNDVFQLFGNLGGIKTFNIMIFDRWGEKVFDSDSPTFTWDGSYKGELLPPSVCVYVMKAVFLDGHNEKIYKGSITILR